MEAKKMKKKKRLIIIVLNVGDNMSTFLKGLAEGLKQADLESAKS
jgi:hypothetical protein